MRLREERRQPDILRRLGTLAVVCLALWMSPIRSETSSHDVLEDVRAALAGGRLQEAADLLRTAAEDGNQQAKIALALALVEGRLTAKDETEAMSWLISLGAGTLPDDNAVLVRDLRASLSTRLSAEDMARATEMAVRRHEVLTQATLARFLYSSAVEPEILFMDGCAANDNRPGCSSTNQGLTAEVPRCSREIPLPDTAATSRGPLARSRIPDELMRQVGSGKTLIVVYVAHVDRSGYVCRVGLKRSSGVAKVDAGVIEAVATWRFQPATVGATTVESLHTAAVTLAKR